LNSKQDSRIFLDIPREIEGACLYHQLPGKRSVCLSLGSDTEEDRSACGNHYQNYTDNFDRTCFEIAACHLFLP